MRTQPTIGSVVYFLTWEQYFNVIPRTPTKFDVQEHWRQTGRPSFFSDQSQETEDCSYRKIVEVVKEFKTPMAQVKESMLRQLKEAGVGVIEYDHAALWQETVEQAVVESLNNFGDPNCIVDLGDGTFLTASTNSNDLELKMLNPIAGALVVYRPMMFVLFKLTDAKKEEKAST